MTPAMHTKSEPRTLRELRRLKVAIAALNDLHRETKDTFHAHAEIHLDDLETHITAIRGKLTRAHLALGKLRDVEVEKEMGGVA